MKPWASYAGVAAVVIGAGLLGTSFFMPDRAFTGVWIGAVIAYAVQLLAFAVLLRARRGDQRAFLLGWSSGIALRFVAVVVAGLTLRGSEIPLAPVLISLVAFVFVLALLEPVFLRMAD